MSIPHCFDNCVLFLCVVVVSVRSPVHTVASATRGCNVCTYSRNVKRPSAVAYSQARRNLTRVSQRKKEYVGSSSSNTGMRVSALVLAAEGGLCNMFGVPETRPSLNLRRKCVIIGQNAWREVRCTRCDPARMNMEDQAALTIPSAGHHFTQRTARDTIHSFIPFLALPTHAHSKQPHTFRPHTALVQRLQGAVAENKKTERKAERPQSINL